jgi:hypothetical protein
MIKTLLKLGLFVVGFNTIEHFCHKKTDGFSISRIQFHREDALPSKNIPHAVFNQSFHYLDAGNQCFVFTSEDDQYVLKFFKYVDHAPPAFLTKIPLLNSFKPLRQKRIDRIQWKRQRDFQAYTIAFDQFREESGLLDLHLHLTTNYPTIILYDKLGIQHNLDLNRAPFVLQKKAIPVYTQFQQWIEQNQIDKLQNGIKDLINLCALRISKNITDDDVHFYSNFGFVNEKAIQVDPGHFSLSQTQPDELAPLSIELKEWLAKHYPTLVSYVEDYTLHQ